MGVSALSSGCIGDVAYELEGNARDTNSIEFSNVDAWASGTVTEYRGEIVVHGDFENVSSDQIPFPAVRAEYFDGNGDTITTDSPRYYYVNGEQMEASDTDLPDVVEPDDQFEFRFIYNPSKTIHKFLIYAS